MAHRDVGDRLPDPATVSWKVVRDGDPCRRMPTWVVFRPVEGRAEAGAVAGLPVAQDLGQGAFDYLASRLPATDRIRDVL